ncbi:MAG: hypothetical protein IH801_05140, partial [Nitrospinae bacterium]|nr:hypothetical protein [Nitrospinota bacterium]
ELQALTKALAETRIDLLKLGVQLSSEGNASNLLIPAVVTDGSSQESFNKLADLQEELAV